MRTLSVSLSLLVLCLAARPLVRAGDALRLDPRALAVVERFESTWRRTQAASYRIVKLERLRKGNTVREELAVKLQKPGRVYVRMLQPIEGREILYDRTKDPRRLTVHNGQFPDLTLNLDVDGMLATHDQHHTIEDLGFDQAVHVFRSALDTARRDPQGEYLEYAGETRLDGRAVERVVMHTGKRAARSVIARADESLLAFARRVDMDAYVIYVANPQIRSLTSELDEGERYTVPAYYAQRCDSWFDKLTGLPLKQVMYDAAGKLYESYEHFDILLDPKLSNTDFDPKNPAYNF